MIAIEKRGEAVNDTDYMRAALALAEKAAALGETPVGAVVVRDGEIIAEGYNLREQEKNALSHAELIAINSACRKLGGWRLCGCTLYVTLEPCPMCAGAILNARIPRVVFGASDPKSGAFGSLTNLAEIGYNHTPEMVGGVLADESAALLRKFFKELRNQRKV